jgi:hypothetical protein
LPPINPTIAPKPIFQVVVHVSNKLIWRGEGVELNDNKIDVTRDKVVNETTVTKTHLKSEIEFFITHTPKLRKIVTNRLRKQRSEWGAAVVMPLLF